MAVGDIKFSKFTIGSMDALDSSQVSIVGFKIDEDILNPLGPILEVRLNDYSDALGKYKITGKEDVKLTFGIDGFVQDKLNFDLKLLQNKNLTEGSLENKAMHTKEYDLRAGLQEILASQGNYIQESFETQTSEMTKQIYQKYLKTDKTFEIKSPTDGQRRLIFSNEPFLQVFKKLNMDHVSSKDKSSCFVTFFQTDESKGKFIFATYEELFKQSPVVKLSQTTTLSGSGSTDLDRQNSIIWFNVNDSFFTPSRPLSKSAQASINMTTNYITKVDSRKPQFYTADGNRSLEAPSTTHEVQITTINDNANNRNPNRVPEARQNRAAFIALLTQNSGDLEVYGNPKIKLGSMIELNIPKKADPSVSGKNETQFNGKALVTRITHIVKPLGQNPRYTMVLKVVKASNKEGEF
jgi:hypothetical protein